MFQVGDIVQVIIVPKKYKQYDITGATGIVKTVYSNNIRIHISSYYNEKSEEGDFYFKENELDNFTRKENDMSIIELWEKRSIEKIDKEAEIKLMELLAEDEYTHDLILHMNDLKDAGFKVEIPNNIYDMTSDYTRGMRTITLSSAEEKKVEIKKVAEEVGFTYAVLDRYIRTGICDDPETKRRIDRLHTKNKFKLEPMPYFNYKEDNDMSYCSPEDIAVALEKAQETINHKHVLDKELRSCERQIKDALGVDVYIMPKDEHVYKTLSKDDISFVGRTKDIATGKIRTTVGFKDGTQTSVVLNNWEDEDDTEKAIMWCLLKKCFKSKRSLEKVIYSMEDM